MSYIAKDFNEKIVRLLKSGSIGLLPSDTIYGLSCRAMDRKAVERIRELKQRDKAKPFIILISDVSMLDQLGVRSENDAVNKYWPGPVTLIFNARGAPAWLERGTKKLAIRLPEDQKLRALINKIGPIVSTSANLQSRDVATSVDEAKRYFGEQLDFYVDHGEIKGEPSTLISLEDNRLKIIRRGAAKIRDDGEQYEPK